MELITLIVTYKAYVDNIEAIDRRKLEGELEEKVRDNLDYISVAPQTGNEEDDEIQFNFDDTTVATDLQLLSGWSVNP